MLSSRSAIYGPGSAVPKYHQGSVPIVENYILDPHMCFFFFFFTTKPLFFKLTPFDGRTVVTNVVPCAGTLFRARKDSYKVRP